ncbi:MAG: acyl-CoA thioesterase [Syntrophales bacterium LBB04]|nr:acyl-CoA thioesterase [Syntrophales bacterium LBB04]
MKGKKVAESTVIMAQEMRPQDANSTGYVQGGTIMKLIETAAGVVAARHARADVVTVSVDRLDFYHTVLVGEFVTMRASLNFVGRTSMEVGVRVESENPVTGSRKHTSTAYLTFVALNKKGRPTPLPPIILETKEQERRHEEAKARRQTRLLEKTREKEVPPDPTD